MPAPIAVQLAAAILGHSLMAADHEHVSEQTAEAQALNEVARANEAAEMDQTTSALRGKMAAAEEMSGRAVKAAAAALASGMEKEALGALLGGLARAGGAAIQGMGRGAQAMGRLALPTTGTTRLLQAAGSLPQGPGRLQQAVGSAGGWLQSRGSAMAARGQLARPAAAAAASAPLVGMGTKAKLLGAGALLGTGYVGMKGLQSARDYMMQPTGYGGSKGYLMHNVNEMGYPQY